MRLARSPNKGKYNTDIINDIIKLTYHLSARLNEKGKTFGMLNCISRDDELREQNRVNKVITRQLKEEKRQRKREKVDSVGTFLVLGGSGSGKSTVTKLIRITLTRLLRHRKRPNEPQGDRDDEEEFSEEERKEYAESVRVNVFMAIKQLVLALRELSIKYENPANEELSERFINIDPSIFTESISDYCGLIKQVWNDSGVNKECYDRRNEFGLAKSAKYFLDALDRISTDQYLPTTEDILRVYEPTTGSIADYHAYGIARLVEIGNQSLERCNRWIRLFDNVIAVFFIVDISEYDVVSESSGTSMNHLETSRLLFENLCQIESCFSVVLCFTKKDIFDEKIYHSNLADFFPAYSGPEQDINAAMEFIRDMFMTSAKHGYAATISGIIKICATDVVSVETLRPQLRDSYVRYHLRREGLL